MSVPVSGDKTEIILPKCEGEKSTAIYGLKQGTFSEGVHPLWNQSADNSTRSIVSEGPERGQDCFLFNH